MGDPACELMAAWTSFSDESRRVFRDALAVDAATWARGRGRALTNVIGVQYYRDTSPVPVASARRAIDEVLADHKHGA